MKYGSYGRDEPLSYALGPYPALELLRARPQAARAMLYAKEGLRNEGVVQLLARCQALSLRCEEAPRALARLSGKDNCYAALAFEKYEDALCPQSQRHIVLEHIADMGNLGTIVRTALALGYRDIAIVRPAADAFDPRVIRASMGALFHVRLCAFESFAQYESAFPGRSLYFFRLERALPVRSVAAAAQEPLTLVFGNEASGLSKELLYKEQGVLIPQSGAVDSLNLAVAAGIGMHLFSKEESIP